MFAYFGEKYARGSVFFETVSVTESSAILRIKFTDSVYRQFGNYRKACVANICEGGKGALAAIPEAVHHLKPATVKDRACIVNDDEYCEWEFHWEPQGSGQSPWLMAGFLQYAARDPSAGYDAAMPRIRSDPARDILVKNIQDVWTRLHPVDKQLFELTGAKSFITVPLKTKKRILGAVTVQRMRHEALVQDDVEVVTTVAGQLAVALDNAEAYGKIEALSIGLEAMVRERTAELEQAVKKLKEMDELKSLFLAHVSHELRTPLTSITGFIDNMLNGLTGPLTERQGQYLTRDSVERRASRTHDCGPPRSCAHRGRQT